MSPARRVGRVLVDVAGGSGSALEEALELAARLEAELFGLFVEDVALLRSAALPFVRQVGAWRAAAEEFDTPRAERELRVSATRARAELERLAGSRRVPWSFRVGRGEPLRELARAAALADLLVLRGAAASVLLSPAARAELGLAGRSVLYLRGRRRSSAPVVVAYAAGPGQDEALGAAALLAGNDRPLVVLLAREEPALRRRAQAQLDALIERPRVRLGVLPDVGQLERALREEAPGLLVLLAPEVWPEAAELVAALETLELSLLVWDPGR